MQKALKPGQRLGIMGGTFNPVHLGHLRAAEEIAESLKLDQIYFMPSARPPHKSPNPLVGYWHRLEMLKLAVSDRPGFWASDLENHLPTPSYTVNTVRAFKKAWSARTGIFFLVGLDSFMTLTGWHQYRELLNLASFVVFGRAGIEPSFDDMRAMLRRDVDPKVKWNSKTETFTAPNIKPIYFRPGGKLAISSTDLRQRLEAGASVRYLVPEPVRVYIEKNGLYRPDNRPE
ncbi:nicotinate (nicotinamide) nucleotide adenylyltransferase [Deltaproteobacteria bacterium Smac51]|nr:nicotinate (nicotinamide) nucleotide adenylyltransferase [Deltaproteobacteria bacterium Smac51]